MSNEVYNSSTHGPIPLSFTGRRLLANERAAAEAAIEAEDFLTNDKALSKARGDLAQYMSKLEGIKYEITHNDFVFHLDRGMIRETVIPTTVRLSPEQQSADEFLDAAREFNVARAKLVRCAEQAKFVGLKPTWCRSVLGARPSLFNDWSFPQLVFEVSRTMTKTSVELMGREP